MTGNVGLVHSNLVNLIFRDIQNIIAQNDKVGLIALFELADSEKAGHIGSFCRIKANGCFNIDTLVLPEIRPVVGVSGNAALDAGEWIRRLCPRCTRRVGGKADLDAAFQQFLYGVGLLCAFRAEIGKIAFNLAVGEDRLHCKAEALLAALAIALSDGSVTCSTLK